MHLLNKALTTKLWQPVLVTHLPLLIQHMQLHPAPSAGLILCPLCHPAPCIRSWAARPGYSKGGSAPSWPDSTGPAGNQDLSPPGSALPWIKKMVSPCKHLQSQAHPPHCQEVWPWHMQTQPSQPWSVVKAQGGTQTTSKLWQPTVKPVLLQHRILQPTLDYKWSGYCNTYFNAVFQLQSGDTPRRSWTPADDYRSAVEGD